MGKACKLQFNKMYQNFLRSVVSFLPMAENHLENESEILSQYNESTGALDHQPGKAQSVSQEEVGL